MSSNTTTASSVIADCRSKDGHQKRSRTGSSKTSSIATPSLSLHIHAEGAIRHAEKRRIGTCSFADRVAQASLECYRLMIPEEYRQTPTCVSTILVYRKDIDELRAVALGVGTKFLKHNLIIENGGTLDRVRDCHAEVLARRSFKLFLLTEMKKVARCLPIVDSNKDSSIFSIFENVPKGDNDQANIQQSSIERAPYFRVKNGITFHMYTSSAPCGNATIKKFAQMKKEIYNDTIPSSEWPEQDHVPIQAHSIRLGQFSLLVKLDRSSNSYMDSIFHGEANHLNHNDDDNTQQEKRRTSKKPFPAMESDDWCPGGTSISNFGKGTLHTCSDKICRWNCLGIQGSLLLSLIDKPLYMTTLTVARKFTECICRRAVCCRALGAFESKRRGKVNSDQSNCDKSSLPLTRNENFYLNHPIVMGTGVYMDESGVLDMEGLKESGQDVRFHSDMAWIWCPAMESAGCINGTTGYVEDMTSSRKQDGRNNEIAEACCGQHPEKQEENNKPNLSQICTLSFFLSYWELYYKIHSSAEAPHTLPHAELRQLFDNVSNGSCSLTLEKLRSLKRELSPAYENAKDDLLLGHKVFSGWMRREKMRRSVVDD